MSDMYLGEEVKDNKRLLETLYVKIYNQKIVEYNEEISGISTVLKPKKLIKYNKELNKYEECK